MEGRFKFSVLVFLVSVEEVKLLISDVPRLFSGEAFFRSEYLIVLVLWIRL